MKLFTLTSSVFKVLHALKLLSQSLKNSKSSNFIVIRPQLRDKNKLNNSDYYP